MTREKAIKIVKEFINGTCLHLVDQEALETLIPELKESEDERIGNVIYCIVRDNEEVKRILESNSVSVDNALVYLEKQKESYYTKRNALFDKCVENCDSTIMKKVSDEVDEMLEKEQKVDIDKLRRDLYQSGYNDGYQHGKEDAQKEQKPKNILTDDDSLQTAYLKGQTDVLEDPEAYGLQKEQKLEPIFKIGDKIKLKSELNYPYREIVDIRNGAYYFDEAVYLLFDNQDNWEKERKPVKCELEDAFKYYTDAGITISCGDVVAKPKEQKPAEWSEEDEDVLQNIIQEIEWERRNTTVDKDIRNYDRQLNFLKSLRPSWKPSDEQMEALRRAVNKLAKTDVADSVRLSIMYDNLKKLM